MRSKYTLMFLLPLTLVLSAQVSTAQYIKTFAGNGTGAGTGTGAYTGDGGVAQAATLNSCTGVCFDGAGNVYIADRSNNVVRKVSYTGIVSTFAGTGTSGYSGDLGPATNARLSLPYGVAADVAGNVYIADYANNVVRKVNTQGFIVTYAGTGTSGYSGDGGAATAARMSNPQGIAVDQNDNVYVSEVGNHIVRKIATDGTIATIAGNGTLGYSGNGGDATHAQLNAPSGVTVDVFGNVYIADRFNNVIRKVDATGTITTIAGMFNPGNSGDGGQAVDAKLNSPSGVSIYGHGDLYISDQANNEVRKIDGNGVITRVAGSITNGYLGDGGPALNAELSSPKGLAVDGNGRVFVADYDNNVIRLIYNPVTVSSTAGASGDMKVYPNPSAGIFTLDLPVTASGATVVVTDMEGRVVATRTADKAANKISLDLSDMPAGNYLINATAGQKAFTKEVVIAK